MSDLTFQVTFKAPNAVDLAIDDKLALLKRQGYTDEQLEAVSLKLETVGSRFTRYGELITVEFDAALDTATVLRVK
ncbi:MAG: hypothetical protein EBU46_00215 [Nitrosomonadaceae bacterium]|nr:hypothetical protein [Nitrosomonadaceae bacterium]